MSGGLLVNALLRETGRPVSGEQAQRLQQLHAEFYEREVGHVRPLPGAKDLLASRNAAGASWAIATSGRLQSARPALESLGVGAATVIITRDQVDRAKPDPDLFLAAAERLGVAIGNSVVVGDSDGLWPRARPGAGCRLIVWWIWPGRIGRRRRLPCI